MKIQNSRPLDEKWGELVNTCQHLVLLLLRNTPRCLSPFQIRSRSRFNAQQVLCDHLVDSFPGVDQC